MPILFFRILAGISPFLVAFLEDKFNISFAASVSVTFDLSHRNFGLNEIVQSMLDLKY